MLQNLLPRPPLGPLLITSNHLTPWARPLAWVRAPMAEFYFWSVSDRPTNHIAYFVLCDAIFMRKGRRTYVASEPTGMASAGGVKELQLSAETQDRTGDLEIFSLTLSQLSYRGKNIANACPHHK